jgi:hypothetical protein
VPADPLAQLTEQYTAVTTAFSRKISSIQFVRSPGTLCARHGVLTRRARGAACAGRGG